MQGTVINALSGFYYVSSDAVYSCRLRGKLKNYGYPLVGDRVEFTSVSPSEGIIEAVFPRKNEFIRPAVSNIDAMVFIASRAIPCTDPFLIDRVSVIAEDKGCEFIVCFNKNDLVDSDELVSVYSDCGFTAVSVSAATGDGFDSLLSALKGKVSVLTGNSGVGKSSIINRLLGADAAEVAEVSEKLGRGKHTTRKVSFYKIAEDTFTADTPGFASFDVSMVANITKEKLQYDFPEFADYLKKCRFSDCAHLREPDCAVTQALRDGLISESRYNSYCRLYSMISQHKSWDEA